MKVKFCGVVVVAPEPPPLLMLTVSDRLAERAGVTEADLAQDRSATAFGASPEMVALRLHRFHDFRIGPISAREPLLPVVPMPEALGDALIGANFLAGRRVWLSYASQQVYVTTIEPPAPVAMVGGAAATPE